MEGRVLAVERVAEATVRLEVEISAPMVFEPGQYVRMSPAGASDWRSYSMASVPGATTLVFFIRLVEGGSFSTWLTASAKVGEILELSHPTAASFCGTGLAWVFRSIVTERSAQT